MQRKDFKDRDARLIHIFDIVYKRGVLSFIECIRLKLLNQSFHRKYGSKEQILHMVAICHCTRSAQSGSWGYDYLNDDDTLQDCATSLQFRFWRNNLVTPEVLQCHRERYGIGIPGDPASHYVKFYERMAALNAEANTSSPGQLGEIMRDVRRTFPSHPFFHEGARGSIMLGRILRAFFAARPDIGYCQGMNFVVGVFILARLPVAETGGCNISSANAAEPNPTNLNGSSLKRGSVDTSSAAQHSSSPSTMSIELLRMTQEADIFLMMISLISPHSTLDMSGMWAPGVPKMKLRVFQFDRLFKSNLPKLHDHFDNLKLAPEVLVAQWIITLYSYTVPVPITMGLWDYIMLGGWAAVYRIALTILSYKQKELLGMDLDKVGKTMREWKGTQIVDGVAAPATTSLICIDDWNKRFLLSCDSLPVTSEVLLQMHEHYGMELIYSAENQDLGNMIRDKHEQDENGGFTLNVSKKISPLTMRRDQSSSSLGSGASSKTRELEPAQVGWFERYGEDLSPTAQTDMTDLAQELRSMDVQVEKDKVCLQRKILETCDMVKTADERARKAIRKQGALKLQVSDLERNLEETMWRSEKIAYYVGVLVNTTGNVNIDPSVSGSGDNNLDSTGGTGTTEPSRDTSIASEYSDITMMSDLDHDKCSHFVEDLEAEYLSKDDTRHSSSYEDLGNQEGTISPRFNTLVKNNCGDSKDREKDNSSSRRILGIIGSRDEKAKKDKDVKGQPQKEKKGIGALFRGITKHFGNRNNNGNSSHNDKAGVTNTNGRGNSGNELDGKGDSTGEENKETVRIQNGSVFINIGDEATKQQALLSRIHFFSQESSKCQNEIIEITRKLTELKIALAKADKFMQSAVMVAEDAIIRKKSLCEQLQLLSQTANDMRSKKLLTAVDKHGT